MAEFKLGPLGAHPDGKMQQYEVDGLAVLVFRQGDNVSAVDGICPHRGAQLVQGQLEGTTVFCPWHDWAFDVITGCGITNPTASLKCFKVEVRSGEIFLIKS